MPVADNQQECASGKGCGGKAQVEDESHGLFDTLNDSQPCFRIRTRGLDIGLWGDLFQLSDDLTDIRAGSGETPPAGFYHA